MFVLIVAWTIFSKSDVWTALAVLVLIMPSLFLCLSKLMPVSNFFTAIRSLFSELKILALRSLVTTALLPFEAFRSMDAMLRVAFRRLVSHHHLLQWASSEFTFSGMTEGHQKFVFQLGWVSVFGAAILGAVFLVHPEAWPIVFPFCLLWIVSPFVVFVVDKPLNKYLNEELSDSDRQMLRKTARKTWRYFDELVCAKTHWLPPDNYQIALNIEVAQRTSPTNIGMWLLAAMSAYDFKYITCDALVDRTIATIQQMKNLERHEGHFLNWYDIKTLESLFPKYVSTVDSGNLIACLWTLMHGMHEMISSPIIPKDAMSGINDTYGLHLETANPPEIELAQLLNNPGAADNLARFIATIKAAIAFVRGIPDEGNEVYWFKQVKQLLNEWDSVISRYFAWVEILTSLPLEQLHIIDPQAQEWRNQALSWKPSLEELASENSLPALDLLIGAAQRSDLPKDIACWGRRLQDAFSTSRWFAGEKIGLVRELIAECDRFSQEMNLKFLYDKERKLFAIGYNVDDSKLDASYYDLLASEAGLPVLWLSLKMTSL